MAVIAGTAHESCGYQGLPIRPNITEGLWWLGFGLGVCEEYTNTTDQVLLSPMSMQTRDELLVATPSADFCIPDSGNDFIYWLGSVNVIIFVLYLVRLRRLQFVAARETDKAIWSAADYSVMISELIKGGLRDTHGGVKGVEERLLMDLKNLGFTEDQIDHVELGIECADEMVIIRKVQRLETLREEIVARSLKRQDGEQPQHTQKTQDKLDRVDEQLGEQTQALEELREKKHKTTGHAFVVFKKEVHRNVRRSAPI